MKPIKSVLNHGVMIELLEINGKFYVRKRVNGYPLIMQSFTDRELADRYYTFIRG